MNRHFSKEDTQMAEKQREDAKRNSHWGNVNRNVTETLVTHGEGHQQKTLLTRTWRHDSVAKSVSCSDRGWSSIPCTHVGRLQLQGVQGELNLLVSEGICTHIHRHTYKVHKTKKEISFKRTVGKNTLLEDYKARVALGNILSHLKAKIPFD